MLQLNLQKPNSEPVACDHSTPAVEIAHIHEQLNAHMMSAIWAQFTARMLELCLPWPSLVASDEPKIRSSNSLEQIPDVVWELVFANLSCDDIILGSALVCKTWRDISYSAPTWSDRCDQQVATLALTWLHRGRPYSRHSSFSHFTYPQLPRLVLALYKRNLLRNPTFRKTMNTGSNSQVRWRKDAWVVNTPDPSNWAWECPPVGGPAFDAITSKPPLPYPSSSTSWWFKAYQDRDSTSCIATSFTWAEVMQVVSLVEELMHRGLSEEEAEAVLDSSLTLEFSVLLGSRYDCDGVAQVTLMLDELCADTAPALQNFVAGCSRYHFHSGRMDIAASERTWQRFTHSVVVPCGCRRAVVLLRGRDGKYWAGSYGTKFANAQLAFVPNAA